jgi:hypothetical protein
VEVAYAPIRQKIFDYCLYRGDFFIIDMVRRRRLREEYSVLWLTTSVIMFVLVVKYDWLETITKFIGAGLPTTTLFIGSIVFLMLISVQFSIKISKLTNQVKDLVQDNTLLRSELKNRSRSGRGGTPGSEEDEVE